MQTCAAKPEGIAAARPRIAPRQSALHADRHGPYEAMAQMDQRRTQCPGTALNPASPDYRHMSKEKQCLRARGAAALLPVSRHLSSCLFVQTGLVSMCNPPVPLTLDSSGAGIARDSMTP